MSAPAWRQWRAAAVVALAALAVAAGSGCEELLGIEETTIGDPIDGGDDDDGPSADGT